MPKFIIISLISNFALASPLIACNQALSDNELLKLGFNSVKLKLLDQEIESEIKSGFPGAGLLIIKDNQIVKSQVYGYRLKYNLKTGFLLKQPIPLNCNSLFDLASNTKVYATLFAIMHLVYLNKLDLNKPVAFYLPEYSGCDKHKQCRSTRTVKELLTHSAGYMPDPQFYNPKTIKKYGAYLYSQESLKTKQILLTKLPFIAKVGTPNYSDVDFMLLGILVEKITKQKLEQYLAQEIYQPLGLKNTLFNPYKAKIKNCAATEIHGNTRGFTINFPNIRTLPVMCQVHDENAYYSMGGVSGHAGLFSNLKDMSVLAQVVLNNGRYKNVALWDKKVQAQFLSPNLKNDSYALGWRLAGCKNRYKPFGDYTESSVFGHTGWTGTLTLYDIKNKLAIILLTNKRHTLINQGQFLGDNYLLGKYYPIINLIYQTLEK